MKHSEKIAFLKIGEVFGMSYIFIFQKPKNMVSLFFCKKLASYIFEYCIRRPLKYGIGSNLKFPRCSAVFLILGITCHRECPSVLCLMIEWGILLLCSEDFREQNLFY